MEFDEAFGRSRTLHNAVTVKCTKGIPDKVYTSIYSRSDSKAMNISCNAVHLYKTVQSHKCFCFSMIIHPVKICGN